MWLRGPKGKASEGDTLRPAETLQNFATLRILEKYNGLFIISPKYFLHLARQSISQRAFWYLGPSDPGGGREGKQKGKGGGGREGRGGGEREQFRKLLTFKRKTSLNYEAEK